MSAQMVKRLAEREMEASGFGRHYDLRVPAFHGMTVRTSTTRRLPVMPTTLIGHGTHSHAIMVFDLKPDVTCPNSEPSGSETDLATKELEMVEQEIPVAPPIHINGQTIHQYQGYLFSLFESVGGRQFEVDNFDQLEGAGRFLGRIHKVGERQLFKHRPTMGLDEYLRNPRELLVQSSVIPSHLENSFFSDLDMLIKMIEAQWSDSSKILRLHGDCHPGNILWRDGPMFVDLDDARNGPAIQDLWMLLNGERADKLAQLDTILEGYSDFCDFNPAELALIEPLRGLRMVHYMAWLTKRWDDPAFPIAFPWFNDPRYWEGQVLAFKEQMAALQDAPLSLMPQW